MHSHFRSFLPETGLFLLMQQTKDPGYPVEQDLSQERKKEVEHGTCHHPDPVWAYKGLGMKNGTKSKTSHQATHKKHEFTGRRWFLRKEIPFDGQKKYIASNETDPTNSKICDYIHFVYPISFQWAAAL